MGAPRLAKKPAQFPRLENEKLAFSSETGSKAFDGAFFFSKRGDFERPEPFFRLWATNSIAPFSPHSPPVGNKAHEFRGRAGRQIREIRPFSGGQRWGLAQEPHIERNKGTSREPPS